MGRESSEWQQGQYKSEDEKQGQPLFAVLEGVGPD